MLQALAVPSAAFEPRFRGSFRSLVYTRAGVAETQEMMAYKVRRTYRHTQTDKKWMLMKAPTLIHFWCKNSFRNHCFFY